jgi:choline dehydrogenase-like flavoprotein
MEETRLAALRALADTVVPRIEHDPDPDGFWLRTATEVGADQGVAMAIEQMPAPIRAGFEGLLDAIAPIGLDALPQEHREAALHQVAASSPDAAAGLAALSGLTLFFTYGAPDPATGRNPNWATFGYPGPVAAPPPTPKELHVEAPRAGTIEADAVVVGSGAGGSVIAAELAARGLSVVVLEQGGYFNEEDFAGLELKAYQELWWRGGPQPTVDGNVTLQAGATLGGGTTINWTNCYPTFDWVRREWADAGLEDVAGPAWEDHLHAVLGRIGATDALSDLNGPQERLRDGCAALGWSTRTVLRNADPDRYAFETAGFLGFGDASGAKLSTPKTYLKDAEAAGARIVVGARADRVLVKDGRAAGVEAGELTVRAPRVVVAGGALESPALLLRSGLGGPAAGRNLRVHPCIAVFGVYEEDQRAWLGAPHALQCDEHTRVIDDHGFIIEGVQYAPAITGSAIPWGSGAEHKELMSEVRYGGSFIARVREFGGGSVSLGPDGEGVPAYAVEDPRDVELLRRGVEAAARIHKAAGAREIVSLAVGLPRWRRGEPLEDFVAAAQAVPLAAAGHRLFSAHQMGTCRMGADPGASVANPEGELHDTPGVWIGDGSAFPTPSGANPMVSIMTLARRTAHAIANAG